MEGIVNKEKKKNRRQIMDKEVNDMISKNIKPVNIIIQCKTEIGQGPADFFPFYSMEGFTDIRPVKGFQKNFFIFNYIGLIVKLPRTLKAVGIDYD
ncbi:MAG: hypothetical protein STSR0003_02780 [Smithella sp.]